jgi:hypothetical protein
MLFAALHESACGPKQTSRSAVRMTQSGHGQAVQRRLPGCRVASHQGYSRAPTGSEGLGFCSCEGALYLLANGSAAFRRYSMKSCAAGLKARFFSVVMLVVPRAMASSTGKTYLGKAVFCYPPWGPWLLSHTARTDSKQKQLRLHVHRPLRARTNSRAEGLKVLDPKRPIREADMDGHSPNVR